MNTNNEFVLCYIDEKRAYFTTQDIGKQWGDDWDDRPYEHNAGEPYPYHELDSKSEKQSWEIVSIFFDAPLSWLNQPCDGCINSRYSVQDINRGVVAWLWCKDKDHNFVIHAGTPIQEFIKIILSLPSGEVYVPISSKKKHTSGEYLMCEVTKQCSRCKNIKNISEFVKNRTTKDGFAHYCRVCWSEYSLKYRRENPEKDKEKQKRYCRAHPERVKASHKKWYESGGKEKLNAYAAAQSAETRERYRLKSKFGAEGYQKVQKLRISQGNICAICGIENRSEHKHGLHVDHCHNTGIIRGLLCHNCNVMIGHAHEDRSIIMRSVFYLLIHDPAMEDVPFSDICGLMPYNDEHDIDTAAMTEAVGMTEEHHVAESGIKVFGNYHEILAAWDKAFPGKAYPIAHLDAPRHLCLDNAEDSQWVW